MDEKRQTIGLVECIKIIGSGKSDMVLARIDTGAAKCSIDVEFAKTLNIRSDGSTTKVRSANGRSQRNTAKCTFIIADKKIKVVTTLAERSHMRYKVLIGQNALKEGKFIVDPLIDERTLGCR